MGGVHQAPFTIHLLPAPQQELPQASGLLALAIHWLDDRLTPGIDRPAHFAAQPADDAVSGIEMIENRPRKGDGD